MPSVSAKQHRLMQAVAHNPKFAKKAGIPQSVGEHYVSADKAMGRYADGGLAKKQTLLEKRLSYIDSLAEDERKANDKRPDRAWYDLRSDGKKYSQRRRALLAKGLTGMLGQINEDTGGVEFGMHPGLIDELIGLPAAFSDNAPQWSKNAAGRTAKLRRRIDEVMGDVVPHGLGENLTVAGGEMLGQLPLPAAKLKQLTSLSSKVPAMLRGASKVPGAVLEYLSPTIHPTLGNYASGTAAGGLLGLLGEDPVPDMPAPVDFEHYNDPYKGGPVPFPDSPLLKPRVKKADGGKVLGTARAITAIKNAISHLESGDRSSAIRALSVPEATSHPNVARILEMLRGPENRTAITPMRQAVEADTNATQMPFLAGGGKVAQVRNFFKVVTTEGNKTKSVLDNEDRAWNLADRLQDLGKKGHHVVAATEDEFNAFHGRLRDMDVPIVKKSGGGKVGKFLKAAESVDWKSQLSPETRAAIKTRLPRPVDPGVSWADAMRLRRQPPKKGPLIDLADE